MPCFPCSAVLLLSQFETLIGVDTLKIFYMHVTEDGAQTFRLRLVFLWRAVDSTPDGGKQKRVLTRKSVADQIVDQF